MSAMDDAYALVVGMPTTGTSPGCRPPSATTPVTSATSWWTGHCGYPPEHVTLLLDGEATRHAIMGALSGLAARTHRAAGLLVYISGHGGRLVSGAFAGEYILPVDTVPAPDEDLARTAISGSEFTAALKAIPARKALVIFDCCHAGGIGQPKGGAAASSRPACPTATTSG